MAKLVSKINKTTIGDAVSDAVSEIESLRDEMTEWRDNIEDKFSGTEKFERISEVVDQLDNVQDITVPDELSTIEVEVLHQRKSSKKSPYPRWVRLGNAVNALTAVRDILDEKDEMTDDEEQLRDDVSTAIDEVDGIEFPSMFG